jgi:hypothetical protein
MSDSTDYNCFFTKLLSSEVLTPHVNVVTATGSDPEGNSTSDSDDATVNFTDVLPDVALTKVANPTAARYTGDLVDYTLTITNVGLETFVVTSFVDDKFSLSPECSILIGQSIAPGASRSCILLDRPVSGAAGGSFINTASVVGTDNESNVDTATASATVNFCGLEGLLVSGRTSQRLGQLRTPLAIRSRASSRYLEFFSTPAISILIATGAGTR